jgi:hypothetical protein
LFFATALLLLGIVDVLPANVGEVSLYCGIWLSQTCMRTADNHRRRGGNPPLPPTVGGVSKCVVAFDTPPVMTYYCPALIIKGILVVGDLFDSNLLIRQDLLDKIPPTWKPNYTQGRQSFLQLPVTDWSIPSVWLRAWAKSDFLKRLAPDPQTVMR